jgi:hypothetical protein
VHPLRPAAARLARMTTERTVRSGERMAPSSPTALPHADGRARSSRMTADRISA